MSRYYRRTEPSSRDNLGAGVLAAGLAAGVAAVSFYLTRLFLAREPLDPPKRESLEDSATPSNEETNIPHSPEVGRR